jgi:hypothetical protein
MFFGVIHPTSIMHITQLNSQFFFMINAPSRVLLIRGNSFNRRVICDEKCSKPKVFWRSAQNYFVLALFRGLHSQQHF